MVCFINQSANKAWGWPAELIEICALAPCHAATKTRTCAALLLQEVLRSVFYYWARSKARFQQYCSLLNVIVNCEMQLFYCSWWPSPVLDLTLTELNQGHHYNLHLFPVLYLTRHRQMSSARTVAQSTLIFLLRFTADSVRLTHVLNAAVQVRSRTDPFLVPCFVLAKCRWPD